MSDHPKKDIIHRELQFELLTIACQKKISKRDFTEEIINFEIVNAIDQLKVIFWKKNVAKTEIFSKTHVPKSWKDHFKKKHRFKRWMRWWIKRKPIQYFHIKRITVFPDVRVPPDMKFKDRIVYMEVVPDNET